MGEDDAFDGEEFLGSGGLIEGDEVVAESGDVFGSFDAGDGEVIGVEGVLTSDLGRVGTIGRGLGFGRATRPTCGSSGHLQAEACPTQDLANQHEVIAVPHKRGNPPATRSSRRYHQ